MSAWREVAATAATQHGVITTRQLRACGIAASSIQHAKRTGRLWPIHRGVYAVGQPALSREGRWGAAVLACAGSALSHRPAGVARRIYRGEIARVEVTVPTRGTHRRPGILIHSSPLPEDEVELHAGIRMTTPARTAVDLAHVLADHDRVHGMLREMQYRRLFDREALERANARRPSAILSLALADLRPTRSPLEDAFLTKVIRRHRLPEPECQAPMEGMHVDFRWASARLTVEVHGHNHVNPAMLRADALRDNALGLGGELVLRYLPADVHRHHRRTAEQIRRALAERDGFGPRIGRQT